jgi:hypothetical protein
VQRIIFVSVCRSVGIHRARKHCRPILRQGDETAELFQNDIGPVKVAEHFVKLCIFVGSLLVDTHSDSFQYGPDQTP